MRDYSLNKEDKDMSKSQDKKMAHVKFFKCSSMGHYASMCSNKVDDKTTLPKKKTRRRNRKCYGCNEKRHEIALCPYMKNEGLMSSRKRITGKKASKK